MSDKKPVGNQVDAIPRVSPFNQLSFDLKKQDQFVTGQGTEFTHFKALPSPIGQNDRGSYRRNDGVDTITSNGMLYNCAGIFTATMTDNERSSQQSISGTIDPSHSRLILPRFYNKTGLADGDRIYLAPGDRLYLSDVNADAKVANFQEMDYDPYGDNIPYFPIVKMEMPIVDSQNVEYFEGIDFCITSDGNIRWLQSGKNPGLNPDTGKGRVYSLRYLYKAYWYVASLPKEVRITNVTSGSVRKPERMSYYAVIVREFVFHNQNKGDPANQLVSKTPKRVVESPKEQIAGSKPFVPVDLSDYAEDEE